jgi:hypothetical protein
MSRSFLAIVKGIGLLGATYIGGIPTTDSHGSGEPENYPLEPPSERGLVRGQVGTVVEVLDNDMFEVEFSDKEGRSYAELAPSRDPLIVLHYEPARPPYAWICASGAWIDANCCIIMASVPDSAGNTQCIGLTPSSTLSRFPGRMQPFNARLPLHSPHLGVSGE